MTVRFVDGSRRDLEFGGDSDAVPDPSEGSARTIGRFRGRHLVGLVFPATGASLARDGEQNGLHKAASLVMWLFPPFSVLAWAVWATWLSKPARSQERRRRAP